jgi:hypothetical protein
MVNILKLLDETLTLKMLRHILLSLIEIDMLTCLMSISNHGNIITIVSTCH